MDAVTKTLVDGLEVCWPTLLDLIRNDFLLQVVMYRIAWRN